MLTDYRIYRLSGHEIFRFFLEAAGLCAVIVRVFYRSAAVFLLVLPAAAAAWCEFRRRGLLKKRRAELRNQFKEALLILSSNLAAGYSVENAFRAALPDLELLYGKEGMITCEFSWICGQLDNHFSAEELLRGFAGRSGIGEIRLFSDIFAIARRNRGGITEVIVQVVSVIRDAIEVKEELFTLTAEKQFEQRVMSLVPLFLVFFIDLTSPGYFDVMYRTAAGRAVMTAALLLYGGAMALSAHFLRTDYEREEEKVGENGGKPVEKGG